MENESLNKMEFAIFGDSYVTRLEKFTEGRLHLKGNCKFYGAPGMSTRNKFRPMFEKLLKDKPRYVVLNVGGNDITSTCDPQTVFNDIVAIVDELYEAGVVRVKVASIIERGKFPPWTGMTKKAFNSIRRSVNRKLKRHLKGDFEEVGKRLVYPRHYDADLVHPGLKEGGLNVFKFCVQKALRKCT